MTKPTKLKIVVQTGMTYFFMAALTGSLYRFETPEPKDTVLKLLALNALLFISAYLIAYFGYRTAIKKGQIEE